MLILVIFSYIGNTIWFSYILDHAHAHPYSNKNTSVWRARASAVWKHQLICNWSEGELLILAAVEARHLAATYVACCCAVGPWGWLRQLATRRHFVHVLPCAWWPIHLLRREHVLRVIQVAAKGELVQRYRYRCASHKGSYSFFHKTMCC